MSLFASFRAAIAPIAAIIALAGCERTRVTPPVEMRDFRAKATETGIDISFTLLDEHGVPTIMMFGNGAVRIDDSPDSLASPAKPVEESQGRTALDSTWILYNARLFVTREHFRESHSERSVGAGKEYVCELGVYPYSHFMRKPRTKGGNVQVALVGMDGKRVLLGHARVVWPPEAFGQTSGTADPSLFGNR